MALLPLDIILDILDLSVLSPNCTPDYPTLRALCLVSKRFTQNAQALLFRKVFLWRDSLARSFGTALNPATERGQRLAGCVHCLRVIVRPSVSRKGYCITQRTLFAVIHACPALHEIHMDLHDWKYEQHSLTALRLCPPPVETLRLHITGLQHYFILGLFPNLKYLQIKDAGRHLDVIAAKHPTFALRELHWQGDLSTAEWILLGSLGTLEILTLEAPMCHSTLHAILRTHGHSLRSLSLQRIDKGVTQMLKDHCMRLEEFCCDGFPMASLLHALPPTLEHLQFTGSVGCGKLAMKDLLYFIQDAPSLLNLTYCARRYPIDDPHLPRWLARTCQEHLIVFFYFNPPFGSFPGERIEFEPVNSFPRPLNLSALRLRESELEDHISNMHPE